MMSRSPSSSSRSSRVSMKNPWIVVLLLCVFISLLSFKPSEPYLTQYLLCNKDTQQQYCSFSSPTSCENNAPCQWDTSSLSCGIVPCSNVSLSNCGNDEYDYCYRDGNSCKNVYCYKHFTDDQVNNEIYPWSTYAYLPFLLVLGPFAELVSYRIAILFGILGRVVTRILLIFGNSLFEMQIMQVTYALGTAAEDVFSAYIYYVVDFEHYQIATSYVKATALLAALVSGVLGDLLVVVWDVSLVTLLWISAACVWAGFLYGCFVIKASHKSRRILRVASGPIEYGQSMKITEEDDGDDESERLTGEGMSGNLFTNNPFVHRESLFERTLSNDDTKTHSSLSYKKKVGERRKIFYQQRLDLFRHQLAQLLYVLRIESVLAMVLLWVIGNAVYTILYNYEVSIYEELQGSNNWNGSVLAILLVSGSLGAMLPTLIHSKSYVLSPLGQTASSALNPVHLAMSDSEATIALRLVTAGLLSSCVLFLFIASWNLYLSMTFLALFFACWQYMNVIVYARLASHLKMAQMRFHLFQNKDENVPHYSDGSSHVFSALSTPFLLGDLVGDKEDLQSRSSETLSDPSRTLSARTDPSTDHPAAGHPQTPVLPHYPPHHPHQTPQPRQQPPPIDQTHFKRVAKSLETDPPYSVAVVLIVAMSVVVQVVLQAIFFSWLQLELRSACWMVIFIFIGATAVFLVFTVGYHGLAKLVKELCRGKGHSFTSL